MIMDSYDMISTSAIFDCGYMANDITFPGEVRNVDSYEDLQELASPFCLSRQISVSREECPGGFSLFASRKSSIDISCYVEPKEEKESPVNFVITGYDEEVPAFELPPCAEPRSLDELLREKMKSLKAEECRRRRKVRMEILKSKRQRGLITYNSQVRYQQRSEQAARRTRSCGRFVSELHYIDA